MIMKLMLLLWDHPCVCRECMFVLSQEVVGLYMIHCLLLDHDFVCVLYEARRSLLIYDWQLVKNTKHSLYPWIYWPLILNTPWMTSVPFNISLHHLVPSLKNYMDVLVAFLLSYCHRRFQLLLLIISCVGGCHKTHLQKHLEILIN